MDIVHQSVVKIPNAIIVSGLTEMTQDEEILDYLKTHGKIDRVIPVDDPTSEFYNSLSGICWWYSSSDQEYSQINGFKSKMRARR